MSRRRLIVIGNGMGGGRFVEELLARNGREQLDIVVFGEEPYGCYNRILLSSVLAGQHQPRDIVTHPPAWYAENGVTLRAGVRIERLDTTARTVLTAGGSVEPYDIVVFATGSRPVLPPIAGIEHALVFRGLDDCARIVERTRTGRRAVVIGGGLLGLEAAGA
jgi:nitrite reductase (NADH) large subunit